MLTKEMIISTTMLVTGRGEVSQGHVRVNGIVKDEVLGRRRRKIFRVKVAGQRRGISGTW